MIRHVRSWRSVPCAEDRVARAVGDVVEIGSWWGNRLHLARLARCWGGKFAVRGSWSNEHLVQHDACGLVDAEAARWTPTRHWRFSKTLLPYNANCVNYLRMPSTDGAKHYREHRSVTTPSFGTTQYCGHIAILHIDGNHSYSAAKADVASWSGFVVAGGWIIIDDYVWPYGDGPHRAGDEFLAENFDKIAAAFVMGSALFIQL
jgi:hypothetical protein